MNSAKHIFSRFVAFLLFCSLMNAQQANSSAGSGVVPRLVKFSGKAVDAQGKVVSGIAGATFAIYKEESGGSALWLETQNVQADAKGNYTVQLGATKPDGLPLDLFSSGEARWLGVTVNGGQEQPRVLLLSVPYALKAADAETIGGLPPSAFILANKPQTTGANTKPATATAASASAPPAANPAVTGKGTLDFIPMWDSASDIINSLIFQKNSQVGIGTTAPAATLDVNGKGDVRDTLTLFPKGSDPTLSISGTTFKVDQTGKVTFVAGQAFPGTGTITGVTTSTSSGLQGGGTTGTLNLRVKSAGITNLMLQNPSLTLNATSGGGLVTPGMMTLGSTSTIGLKTCAANQILEYSGTAWNCSAAGTGTVTNVGLSAPASDFTVSGSPISGTGTLGLNWNVAPTSTNTANAIVKRDATGSFSATNIAAINVYARNPNGTAIQGYSTTTNGGDGVDGSTVVPGFAGVSGANISGSTGYGVAGTGDIGVIGSGTSYGIAGSGVGANSYGVYAAGAIGGVLAEGSGIPIVAHAAASAGEAVLGVANNDLNYIPAVYGIEWGATQTTFGVQGYSASPSGAGVQGTDVGNSAVGSVLAINAGVWGDSQNGIGVRGTSDGGSAFVGRNNGGSTTAFFINEEAASTTYPVVWTLGESFGGECIIDVSGDLFCSGSKSAVVPVNGGAHKVALYAIEGPENWFEDAGSGQLTNGEAVVNLESVFGETVNTDMNYHVFLTPNGDCKGLYVAQKTGKSFIVRELGGGTSSIAFDYRIMAKRKGYENIRLADKTETFSMKNLPMHRSQSPSGKMPDPAQIRKEVEAHLHVRSAAQPAKRLPNNSR